MANPFDDPNFGASPRKPNPFDDPNYGAPQSPGNTWQGVAGDVLAYGATPLAPLVMAARQGLLGDDAKAYMQGGRRLERSIAQGASDAIADTAGAPFDLAAAGARKVGLEANYPIGGSRMWRDVVDYAGTGAGRVVDAIARRSLDPLTEPRTARIEPQDTPERLAYGFGRGAGGAASMFGPAAVIANAAAPMTAGQGVAQTLAARPAMQAIAGGVGGAVAEETKNPWLGMAASVGTAGGRDLLAGGARRLATPAVRLTPDEKQIIANMERLNIPVTPAQATGSGTLHNFEQSVRHIPGAGHIMDKTFDAQRQAINRAITGGAGTATNRAGLSEMDSLYRSAGTTFDDLITQQGYVQFGPNFPNSVANVMRDYGRRLETNINRTFESYIDDLMPIIRAAQAGQNPRVDAKWYQNVRSDLTTKAREAKDLDFKRAVVALRDALDDAASATRPDLADRWQAVRGQYRNLAILDDAMLHASGPEAAAGNVPLAGYHAAVKRADPHGFTRGRGGEVNDLGHITGYLQQRVPNSGTPQRGLMTTALMGGGVLEPTTVGLGVGVPTALSAAYNSQPVRQMLTTKPGPMFKGTGGVVEALMLQRLAQELQGGALATR